MVHDSMHGVRKERDFMTGAMGSHQSTSALSTSWLTPLEIIAALGGEESFDMDPCASPGWPTARRLVCLPEDGLNVPWLGRVWLNPPYGLAAWTWMERLADHGTGTALVFARTETEGFVRTVWGRASAMLFLSGRLFFHRPDGSRAEANSGAPSVLVAYGEQDARALEQSGIPGHFVGGWDQAGRGLVSSWRTQRLLTEDVS